MSKASELIKLVEGDKPYKDPNSDAAYDKANAEQKAFSKRMSKKHDADNKINPNVSNVLNQQLILDIEKLAKEWDNKGDIGMGDTLQDLMDHKASPRAFQQAFQSLSGKRDDWFDAYSAEGDHTKAAKASNFDKVKTQLKELAVKHGVQLVRVGGKSR